MLIYMQRLCFLSLWLQLADYQVQIIAVGR